MRILILMPNATIFIRKENWAYWESLPNKSEWVNNLLYPKPLVSTSPSPNPYKKQRDAALARIIKTPKQAAKIAAEQTTVSDARKVCPIHAVPLDDRGKCLQKKCKYS